MLGLDTAESVGLVGYIALFGGFIALTAIGLLDHYPWTIIQFQVTWWGLLAASQRHRSAQ